MAITVAHARFGVLVAEYLAKYPDDVGLVRHACKGATLNAKSAREMAELTLGQPMSDGQWNRVRLRWDRVWTSLIDIWAHQHFDGGG